IGMTCSRTPYGGTQRRVNPTPWGREPELIALPRPTPAGRLGLLPPGPRLFLGTAWWLADRVLERCVLVVCGLQTAADVADYGLGPTGRVSQQHAPSHGYWYPKPAAAAAGEMHGDAVVVRDLEGQLDG